MSVMQEPRPGVILCPKCNHTSFRVRGSWHRKCTNCGYEVEVTS